MVASPLVNYLACVGTTELHAYKARDAPQLEHTYLSVYKHLTGPDEM